MIISTIFSVQSGNAFFVSSTAFFAPSIPLYSNPPIKCDWKSGEIISSNSLTFPFVQISWYFFTTAMFLSEVFCVELLLQLVSTIRETRIRLILINFFFIITFFSVFSNCAQWIALRIVRVLEHCSFCLA